MAHTKGPWIDRHWNTHAQITIDAPAFSPIGRTPLARVYCPFRVDEKQEVVALSEDVNECEDNARIICAAPDMLAALENVVFQLGTSPKHSANCGLVDDCRAVIAKARGES